MKTEIIDSNQSVKEKKQPQFVAGNPVNKESAKAAEVEGPGAEHFKPLLNLDGTLKLVEELYRRKMQRDKLLATINNLEAFEIELRDEVDATDGNSYQGCVLTIEDDHHRRFVTKNPTIIWTVAQMVNSLCMNKLEEIEAAIALPVQS